MKYLCGACHWTGKDEELDSQLLSIMWREKHDNIQAFMKVQCPRCRSLVMIIFETLKIEKEDKK